MHAGQTFIFLVLEDKFSSIKLLEGIDKFSADNF
jgi:hypothetical protein